MLSPRRIVAPTFAEEVSAILRDADEICAHRFRLLGYENLDFGSEIDCISTRCMASALRSIPGAKSLFSISRRWATTK